MKDYYKVLGVDRNASEAEIKNAYRRLAKKYHPDVSKEENATQKFQELQEAYSILKDPQKKAAYDNPQAHGPHVHEYYHTHGGGDPFSNLHDLFEALRGQARRPHKTVYTVRISLEEAYTGTTRTAGSTPFRIPPGVRTGNRLAVNDFLVDVAVMRHEKFQRSGDDLLVQTVVTAFEAMVGTELLIDHIDGTQIKCKVPAGIQYGQVLRVKDKGMPNPEIPGRRGDLLVAVGVSTPTDLTDEQKEFILSMKVNPRKTIPI